MTAVIKLDTQAMNVLFPEGSEARVDLQRAVISNFAKKSFPKHLNKELIEEVKAVVMLEIQSKATKDLSDGIKDAIEEYFSTRFNIQMLNDGKHKVRQQVKECAKGAIYSVINEQLNEELKSLRSDTIEQIKEIAPVYLESMKGDAFKDLVRAEALRMVNNATKQM